MWKVNLSAWPRLFAGRLDQISVQRGQQVASGAPLFALEADDERAARQQAAEQVRAAESQLADLQTGKRVPEVDVSRAQLAQAQAASVRSAAQHKRDEAQYAIGGIALAQLEESRATAASDAARVRELQRDIDVARLPGRTAQRAAQQAQVAAARAALAQAEWKLSRKTVGATQAGLVYDTPFRLGDWVPAGSPVVRLLPPGNVKVRFYVPESELGTFKNGESMRVRCDGCAVPIAAAVTYISSQAEYTPPVIYSNETRRKLVFLVEARPAPADAPKLHPGQPVEVARP
ncbi:secretion protein HlyD [Cupriavidus basilensis OR16]|uniref:Secretion protein HlyD n=1 Tax=Cupriavidus basilensis OR16 TaxID=1127483 RepID=H1S7I5_9BURK|nr:secretion protein HlyD [Cupriavidus basilensis OR16]